MKYHFEDTTAEWLFCELYGAFSKSSEFFIRFFEYLFWESLSHFFQTAPMIVIFLFFILVHFVYFRIEELLVSPSWQLKDPPVDVSHYAMITPEFWSALLLSTVIAVTPRLILIVFFEEGNDLMLRVFVFSCLIMRGWNFLF